MSDQSSPAFNPSLTDTVSDSGTLLQRQRKKRKKSVIKRLFLTLFLIILLAGSCFGIYWLLFREEPRSAVTDKTLFGSLDRAIEGAGTTVPAETLAVTAVSRAVIKEMFVKAGDTVTAGQLLYTQDDSEVDRQIDNYKKEIEKSKEEILEHETAILEQQKNIIAHTVSINGYNADIAELQNTKDKLTIRADFSGKITKLSAQKGDTVKAGAVLAHLTDETVMKLTQYFSYAYKDNVKLGMPAEVYVSSQTPPVSGTVTDIQWVERLTDEGMKCFAVTVELPNPGILKEGGSASCALIHTDGTRMYPSVDGTLSYKSSVSLTAVAAGEILFVGTTDYAHANAGDVLFIIDESSYEMQLENLKKQIESVNKQIESANKQIVNLEEKIVTVREKIAETEASIEEAEESRAKYAMRSEISGRVMYCTVTAGSRPNTSSAIITIYNMDTMTLSVNFDELDADYVREGTPVTVTRTSASGETDYKGIISYLSPEATSSGGVSTFAAKIEIDSRGELASGISVTYKIALGDVEEGVLAPVAALKSYDEQYYLYVKSDTRPENAVDLINPDIEIPKGFYAVPVEVGNANEQYIRILSGVEADTEVFTRYRQTAPSSGKTTGESEEDEESIAADTTASGRWPNSGSGFGGTNQFPSNSGNSGGGYQRPTANNGSFQQGGRG